MLAVSHISKSFGGFRVLRDISLETQAGMIYGIIGPNGAGKSTLFSVISGFIQPDAGTVTIRGHSVMGLGPERRAALGLARTFQVPRLFESLSTFDNLRVAGCPRSAETMFMALFGRSRIIKTEAILSQQAEKFIVQFNLERVADRPARELSGGQKKLTALARALMTGPKILLLDEPFAGVAPPLRTFIAQQLLELRSQGLCILIIEHDIESLLQMCDSICVLAAGGVLASDKPSVIRNDPRVLEAYLNAGNL